MTTKTHPLANLLAVFVQTDAPYTARQVCLLAALQGTSAEVRTVRGLAERFNMPKPSVTRSMDVLINHGLVFRRQDPADRRSVIMTLTDDGAAVLRASAHS